MEFIQGEKFYALADFVYTGEKAEHGETDWNYQRPTFDIKKLKDTNIVYFHTMYKDSFLNLIKDLPNKFILISSNSDVNINSVDNLPSNVIKWYSQNVNVIDDRLECLPVGLENSRWYPEFRKIEKTRSKMSEKKNERNLLYINHNINNNAKERREPYILFQGKKWATIEYKQNGIDFDNYIDNVYNHKFVLTPEGNGTDTHRRWECFYLNTIPVEKRNNNNKYLEDLPICFVNKWSDITEEFLLKEYDRIKGQTWNMEKIDMDYWRKRIRQI